MFVGLLKLLLRDRWRRSPQNCKTSFLQNKVNWLLIVEKVPWNPRFLDTAGELSAEIFKKSYDFLANKHETELATLRETLKQARKLLVSSPGDDGDLRSEWENEVYRLEQATKRAESMVDKDELDQAERDALGRKKSWNDNRVKEDGFWTKSSVYQLVVKARFEALAKEANACAFKKAILKKQKKMSQPYKKKTGANGNCWVMFVTTFFSLLREQSTIYLRW